MVAYDECIRVQVWGEGKQPIFIFLVSVLPLFHYLKKLALHAPLNKKRLLISLSLPTNALDFSCMLR